MPYEAPRANPRMLDLSTSEFVDFDYDLDDDVQVAQSQLQYLRSESGKIETHPGSISDRLRLRMPDVPLDLKDKLDAIYHRTLVQGGRVEFMADPTKLLHLATVEEYDVRRRIRPTAASIYTVVPLGGFYGLGGLGVFLPDLTYDDPQINYCKNGDFQDGTTGWAFEGTATASLEAASYLQPNGSQGKCGRVKATNSIFIGAKLYTDCEMPDPVSSLGAVTISFSARAERHEASEVADAVALKIKAADGTGLTETVAEFTPRSKWRRYYYRAVCSVGTLGSMTDHTLRVRFDSTSDLRAAGLHITDVQVEWADFASGPVPYSDTRTSATGRRIDYEELTLLSPLDYAHQAPTQRTEGRLAFTVALGVEFYWSTDHPQPATDVYLLSTGNRDSDNFPGLAIWIDGSFLVNGSVLLDDATEATAQSSAQTIEMGTTMHVVLSFQEWDGSTADSGSLDLYINGELAESVTHSNFAGALGQYLFIGNPPSLESPAQAVFDHVTLDGVYIDGETYTIDDFYHATRPPRRERTAWRCILDPAQGEPCMANGTMYSLDLKLIEARI